MNLLNPGEKLTELYQQQYITEVDLQKATDDVDRLKEELREAEVHERSLCKSLEEINKDIKTLLERIAGRIKQDALNALEEKINE